MTNCFLQHFQGTTSIFILCVHLCVDGDPSCASDFLFHCGQEPSAVWTGDWVTARDWQAGLRRGMEAPCCPWHDRTKLWVNVWRWICRRRGVEVTERLIKRPLSAPPRHSQVGLSSECPAAARSKKKQIFLFSPRACGPIPALFTRTGRWPLDLLSCTRLSVSLTKRFTPTGSFSWLVLHTQWLRGFAIVSGFRHNARCALTVT